MKEVFDLNYCVNLYTDKDIEEYDDRNKTCDYDIYIVFSNPCAEDEILDFEDQIRETVEDVILDKTLDNATVKKLLQDRISEICEAVIYVAIAKRIFKEGR